MIQDGVLQARELVGQVEGHNPLIFNHKDLGQHLYVLSGTGACRPLR